MDTPNFWPTHDAEILRTGRITRQQWIADELVRVTPEQWAAAGTATIIRADAWKGRCAE